MSGVLGPYQFQRQLTMLIWWRLEPVIIWLKRNMTPERAPTFREAPKIGLLQPLQGPLRFMLKLERSCISPRKQFFSVKKKKKAKSKQMLNILLFYNHDKRKKKKQETLQPHFVFLWFHV